MILASNLVFGENPPLNILFTIVMRVWIIALPVARRACLHSRL